jgi:hypothetical protein
MKIVIISFILSLLSGISIAQSPRIDSIAVDEDKGELVLHGDFQNSASAVVLVDSVSLPVTLASDTMARAKIPLSQKGSCGWVSITINGVRSNKILLSYIHIDIYKDYRRTYGGGGAEYWSRDYHVSIRANFSNPYMTAERLMPVSRLSNLDSFAGGSDGIGYKYTGPNYNYVIDVTDTILYNPKDRVFMYQGANVSLDQNYEVISGMDPNTAISCQAGQGYCFQWYAHTPTDFPPSNSSVHENISNPNMLHAHLSSDPVAANAEVLVTLRDAMNVRMDILDIFGHVVFLEDRMLSVGENKLPINSSALPPGIYICRLQANGEVASLRFVKG